MSNETNMPSIFHVAEYVLQHLGQMTTMKLEKLVYYCQAWSLAWDDVPLFPEDFEAWANGPVCRELYNIHKKKFVIDASLLSEFSGYPFSKNQIDTMEQVLNYYGDKEPQWLSDLTHQEEPWKIARGNTPPGMHCESIITKQ